ncbi:molybdenum cofactor guanylyltransferase [Pedobacter hartonius]|uniref:Molybdenum cofactor guanylyltransferase n=1 Tax=Pedobacter hartonius TaxID=425514 RepID=A0A1H4GA35_9SPHI|nr:molybdenum cofactor guanylyltransferase [Pedobacter hartonius]SEB06414.1 molybdenum cofactor guanylyltransferase [Pedobacter hartonius]
MLGIVLCGGQSSRMGTDKGLMIYRDKRWAQLAEDQLGALDIPVKLSVNSTQKQVYTAHFPEEQLIADHPSLSIMGPLLGVLSAHLSAPEEDLFVLACDMLLIESRLLRKLLDAFTTAAAAEAYIFTREGQHEPLCGIYPSAGLKRIMFMLLGQGITKPSMKFVLNQLQVLEIPLKEEDFLLFSNFNSRDETSEL